MTGGFAILFALVGVLVSMIQSSLLALSIARLYGEHESAELPDVASARWQGLGLRWSLSTWLAGVVVLALLSGGVGAWLAQDIRVDDDVLVIAHRGAAGRAPENTLASVRAAIEDGADIVEIDVQETADGEVVVIHDSDFMKVAGVSSKIWDLSLAEARAIDIGSWYGAEFASERIPRSRKCSSSAAAPRESTSSSSTTATTSSSSVASSISSKPRVMASDVVVMSLNQSGIRKIRELRPGGRLVSCRRRPLAI